MEILQFYQEAFLRSAEKLIGIEAETRKMLEHLAEEKKNTVAKKIIGKMYDYDDLGSRNEYYYKNYCGHKYKAIMVKTDATTNITAQITDIESYSGLSMITLVVYFMRNPVDVLESKMKLTEKEKDLLKELAWWWKRCEDGVNPEDYGRKKPMDLHRELKNLKHNLYMVEYLTWSYDFNRITDENFLTTGLRARKDLF